MKIAAGMIVFNGEYVLKQCLESIYPYVSQICIAEGPVLYWQRKGKITSTDNTNDIIHGFPDPEDKIKIYHGLYKEKDEQVNAYLQFLDPDTDYLINLDSDELYRHDDMEKLIKYIEDEQPTSIGVKSCSFYGGFDKYIGGFEQLKDNFLRIFKWYPGAGWETHRPPTVRLQPGQDRKHVDSDTLYERTGIEMMHYSYVFPKQVHNKINYYYGIGGMGNRIPNYFFDVYWPWVLGDTDDKLKVEKSFNGVHEYLPHGRIESYTKDFKREHPLSIQNDLPKLKEEFDSQVEHVKEKIHGIHTH
jgi:glycosyltransferase involved in cell wall biosynthesis